MTRFRSVRPFRTATTGNAAIEFALIVPVMLLFMAGIVELGRAFQVYSAVNRLATRYAVAWADCSDQPAGACNTELQYYQALNTIQNFVPQLTNTVTLKMTEFQMSGSAATAIYPAGATLSATELTAAQSAVASGQYGVVVTVTYTHTLIFFQKLMAPFLGTSRSVTYTVAQLKS